MAVTPKYVIGRGTRQHDAPSLLLGLQDWANDLRGPLIDTPTISLDLAVLFGETIPIAS